MKKKLKLSNFSLDRMSARCGIALAALVPLIAVFFTTYFSSKPKLSQPIATVIDGADQRLIDFCVRNIKETRSFVLFQHGTCVVVENESDTTVIKEKALTILKETAVPDARFICTPVEDNNLIVSYNEPVFHLRFQDEMDLHRKDIEQDFRRFLTEQEAADITPAWEPPFHAKVGLRSRARLFKDASSLTIARIIAPQSAENAGPRETASISF